MYYFPTKKLKKNSEPIVFIHGTGMDHSVWTLPVRYFLRKKREGKQLIFFEKIDKNTSREQIKENIKNLLIKQGFKYVPSKKDTK